MSATTLYAVPASLFSPEAGGDANVSALVSMAIAVERRADKEMASAADRARYHALCRTIKRLVAGAAEATIEEPAGLTASPDGVVALRIEDDSYATAVATQWSRDPYCDRRNRGALGAPFLRPEDVQVQLDALRALGDDTSVDASIDRRAEFLASCTRDGCGLVEVVDPERPSARSSNGRRSSRRPSAAPPTESAQEQKLLLAKRLASFLAGGPPVSFGSGARHQEITAALHALVYSQSEGALPILYSDGSQAADFAVGCLPPVEQSAPEGALRLGLMSMRHPELDVIVDGYWFRNKAVSQPRPLAETDAFCFRDSRERLHELRGRGVRFIDLYHTGYEPAVIGFYRALVEHQLRDGDGISVRPIFLDNRAYRPGAIWGTTGDGQ